MFESLRCPVCGGDHHREHLRVPDRFALDDPALFVLVSCTDCGMIFLNPRPVESESVRYYQHTEYLPFSSTKEKRSITDRLYGMIRALNLRWKTRLIRRVRAGAVPGSALDVGCGTGEFLAALRGQGWEVTGVERDETAALWAREHFRLPVTTGDPDALKPGSGPFELVTMWHVLEHLYQPATALRRIASFLADDGLLLIAVPNATGRDARFYKADWIAYDTPRHVSHFSATSLPALLARAGFAHIGSHQLPFDAFFNAVMSEALASRRFSSSRFLWPLRLLRSATVALISLAGGSAMLSARYGATLVFLFRKEDRP